MTVTATDPDFNFSELESLTCFRASFFPFCPLCWPPLFLPFSRHLFALFSPSKSALFCREKGTEQSLERGSSGMHLSTKFGKEIPSRNLREKRSEIGNHLVTNSIREGSRGEHRCRKDVCKKEGGVAYFFFGVETGYLRKSLLTPQITRNHPKP